jgi:hypothetical protein
MVDHLQSVVLHCYYLDVLDRDQQAIDDGLGLDQMALVALVADAQFHHEDQRHERVRDQAAIDGELDQDLLVMDVPREGSAFDREDQRLELGQGQAAIDDELDQDRAQVGDGQDRVRRDAGNRVAVVDDGRICWHSRAHKDFLECIFHLNLSLRNPIPSGIRTSLPSKSVRIPYVGYRSELHTRNTCARLCSHDIGECFPLELSDKTNDKRIDHHLP